jgi:lipoprotein-releasing system permease protein
MAEGSLDTTALGVIYAIVLPIAVWFVLIGRRRLQTMGAARAIFWWVGTAMGLAFLALITISAQMTEPDFGRFDLGQQLIRAASLAAGVAFVFYSLIALQPVVLDGLENRSFESFVSARLMRATKSGFLTVISVLSISGVAVSSCALCCVTSIMGGFGHDLKRKILDNTAHIVVDTRSPAGFDSWKPVLAKVREAAKAQGGTATPVVGGDAMASSATNTAGVLVRGIDPETIGDVIKLLDNIEIGKFDYLTDPERLLKLPENEVIGRGPGGEPYFKGPGFSLPIDVAPELRDRLPRNKLLPAVILGRELAKSLHVMVGDELTLLSPMGELGPMGIMPRARKFRVAAIFYSGMYEYDASHAYVLLEVAQKFFDMQNAISRIDVRVPVPENVQALRPGVDDAVAAVNLLKAAKVEDYRALRVRDWVEMNRNLFSALALEKVATFIILSIAIAVASFCIICTLLLMVTEKTKDIAVMKSLGASDRGVMSIFMMEGMLIGAFGTVLGVVTALAFCLGLSWTGVRLDPDVYYIDRLPVNVDLGDYGMVALAAFAICTIATIYPAFAASRVRPVEGLRYE